MCGAGRPLVVADAPDAARPFTGSPTSPLETRVGDFRRRPSGRLSLCRRRSRRTATGWRVGGCKTASGRAKWLSKDPIAEQGGVNLYGFVGNCPVTGIDQLGDSGENVPPGGNPNAPWPYGPPWANPPTPPAGPGSALVLYKMEAVMQIVGGSTESIGGVALLTGGATTEAGSGGLSSPVSLPVAALGAGMTVNGLDNASTGLVNLFSNARLKTYTERAISSTLSELGVSSSDAETLGSDFNSAFMMAGSATTPFICAPVRITVTAQGTQLYRVFGNRAPLNGQSWTRVNPGTITDYRTAAGLFPGNSGTSLAEGTLINDEGVEFRVAAPGPGGVGGGLDEVVVPDAATQVKVTKVTELKPPY